jgi:ribosomal 50S subunit-recycling heat shock protein
MLSRLYRLVFSREPRARAELRCVRLDKFMKVSRLAKRRSEAHEALEHGRITKDGKTLKPGYQVKPGDELAIHYATKLVTVRVLEVPLRVTPRIKAADLYEILDSHKDETEWL